MTNFTREEIEKVVKAARKLRGANLAGVDLTGADLREADLRKATYNKATEFPDGFDPEGGRDGAGGMKTLAVDV
jgi:hypothetical protein